jgi:1,4-dihydroxy-2-naphthoate octaprenyltransferase
MSKVKSWIKAARLRTLPLALSSVALGGFVAAKSPTFSLLAALLAGLTTLLLQILSNFANDLGDSKSGIDNDQRVGPRRTVQSGELSKKDMKKAVVITAILALTSGLWLLFGVAELSNTQLWLFLGFGLLAIVAAITYTIGKRPYGYLGLGDLFVFLFFGLLGVAGTFFVATGQFDGMVLLPASAMGLWSAGVLNLNNMRDHANDRFSGKRTMVVKIGYHNALFYHVFLTIFPFILLAIFVRSQNGSLISYAFLVFLIPFIYDLIMILKVRDVAKLDPFLRKLAIKTMLVTLLYGLTTLM